MNTHEMSDGLKPLVRALLARATQMNFFQFCQLIERLMPPGVGLGASDTPTGETVRFRPHPKVGFPGTELAAVKSTTSLRIDRPRSGRLSLDYMA